MKYRRVPKHWKYQLLKDEVTDLGKWIGDRNARIPHVMELEAGVLHIRAGYCWDGMSGGAFDTKTAMRGSLVHDALYQLLREGRLDPAYRLGADRALRGICIEDGMWRIRANFDYRILRRFGWRAARPTKGDKKR